MLLWYSKIYHKSIILKEFLGNLWSLLKDSFTQTWSLFFSCSLSQIMIKLEKCQIKVDYKLKNEIDEQYEYMEKVNKMNEGQNLQYAIYTMGCQLNENDSEKISGMLEKMGYSKTEEIQSADIVIFNTCCVRENAEDKLFGKIGEMKRQKEEKGTIIAIGGCMMQEEHIVEKLRKSYPFVDIIFGTHTMHKLAEDVYHILEKRTKIEDVITIDGEIYEGLPIKRNDKTKASVTIMHGCNNFCTYCIVPYVRGRERSR